MKTYKMEKNLKLRIKILIIYEIQKIKNIKIKKERF